MNRFTKLITKEKNVEYAIDNEQQYIIDSGLNDEDIKMTGVVRDIKIHKHRKGKQVLKKIFYACGKAIDKLAEYENAEEQGLLIKLPFKLGSTVYVVEEGNNHRGKYISERKFTNAEIDFDYMELGTDFGFTKEIDEKSYISWIRFDDIKQKVFLTKSEAEIKLKELNSTIDVNQALSILKDRLQTGENLGENEKPQSDYDEFVNEQYTALKIVIEEFEKLRGEMKFEEK